MSLDALSVDEKEGVWNEILADPSKAVWVADDDGRVVGFASTGPAEGEDANAGAGEMYALYIEPELVGTGLGRELFSRAVEGIGQRGFARAVLWVLEGNERARRFYEKAGWVADGAMTEQRMDCENRPTVRYATAL